MKGGHMATATERAARLAAVEQDDDWNSLGDRPVATNQHLIRVLKKREAAEAAARLDALQKVLAQQRQYEETNRRFIDDIIGADGGVARQKTEVATRQAALAELLAERGRVLSQLQTLDQNAAVDLAGISMSELLRTAATREKARTVEVAALVAVRDELGRRIAVAESELADAQHTLLRLQRVALHTHADLLIEQMQGPVTAVAEMFTELRKVEDSIRGLGGPRQPFSNLRMVQTLEFLVERWDAEVADVERFSEAY